jgi:hypothetical protein
MGGAQAPPFLRCKAQIAVPSSPKIFLESFMRLLLLLCVLFAGTGLCCAAQAGGWDSYLFDGAGFVKGSGSSAILTREGYLPVPAGGRAPAEEKLPAGTGAVAVLCFQQRSPGRLRMHPALAPLPGVAITLAGKHGSVVGRTDASGYLILALPSGNYEIRFLGFAQKVVVESGKTALVALRGGKRMVD